MCDIRHICGDFSKVAYFQKSSNFSRAEIFLIRLKCFNKEKYLRSRRAPSAYTKIQNSENNEIIHENGCKCKL